MENVEKLPKWAQYEITKLERNIESLTLLVNQHSNPDAKITYGYPVKHGLPDHTTVSFIVDGVRVDVQIMGDVLKIYSTDTIAVIPNTSNSISIMPKSR